MAGRTLDRRKLRQEADAAQAAAEAAGAPGATDTVPARKQTKAKKPVTVKVRKTRAKKMPPRLRARWGVFDGSMKQIAIFDYNQRAAAEEKVADLLTKKRTIHFLQIVKEPMPEPAPAETIAPVPLPVGTLHSPIES